MLVLSSVFASSNFLKSKGLARASTPTNNYSVSLDEHSTIQDGNITLQEGNKIKFLKNSEDLTSFPVTLACGDSIYNPYLNDEIVTYNNAINGLESLTLIFSGGSVIIDYGFLDELQDNKGYAIRGQNITSGVDYTFNDSHPSYFRLTAVSDVDANVSITSLSFSYKCDKYDNNQFYTYGLSVVDANWDSTYGIGAMEEYDYSTGDVPADIVIPDQVIFDDDTSTNIIYIHEKAVDTSSIKKGDVYLNDLYYIKSISIGRNIDTLYEFAFYNCLGVEALYLPKSITSYPNDAQLFMCNNPSDERIGETYKNTTNVKLVRVQSNSYTLSEDLKSLMYKDVPILYSANEMTLKIIDY